ncbi:hypothetical protein OF83DRAFT_932479 [Amylostereum chailletii]|nr:hypothetical protein OF83DRAFT_932479 [Amylostereum chailletii]
MDFVPPEPSSSIPGSLPLTGVPVAPPPWTLRTKQWYFVFNTERPSSPDDPRFTPEGLPTGFFTPLEKIHPSALSPVDDKSQFIGGPGLIAVVRYTEGPVGPYDELIFSPGKFKNPVTEEVSWRLTTLYVSTPASVWNGRRNWNIAKHLARFEFETVGSKGTIVRVFHPEGCPAPLSSDKPFFSAFLTDSRLPALPVHPALVRPFVRFIQPPLLRGKYPESEPSPVIGTDDSENGRENPWLDFSPDYRGHWGLAYAEKLPEDKGGLGSYGDGVGAPDVQLWSLGAVFEGELIFPIARVAQAKSNKTQ